LLTPQQAADALAISPRKLWSMTAGGEIPCVRIGRLVRYDLADLREWIDGQKSQKTAASEERRSRTPDSNNSIDKESTK